MFVFYVLVLVVYRQILICFVWMFKENGIEQALKCNSWKLNLVTVKKLQEFKWFLSYDTKLLFQQLPSLW